VLKLFASLLWNPEGEDTLNVVWATSHREAAKLVAQYQEYETAEDMGDVVVTIVEAPCGAAPGAPGIVEYDTMNYAGFDAGDLFPDYENEDAED
jgi:hypothetical protein